MNIRKTINKLQSALIAKGYIYKINTYQFYSEQQKRMITGYRITHKQPYRKKNGEMSVKDVELFNRCSQVEVLRWFVEKWNEVKENGESTSDRDFKRIKKTIRSNTSKSNRILQ